MSFLAGFGNFVPLCDATAVSIVTGGRSEKLKVANSNRRAESAPLLNRIGLIYLPNVYGANPTPVPPALVCNLLLVHKYIAIYVVSVSFFVRIVILGSIL